MPDILFKTMEELPEELRSFAKPTADGNGFVVNLVPNEKLKEFRDNNVSLSQERDRLKTLHESVLNLFPEYDPAKAGAELKELRETSKRVKDGELKESGAIQKVIDERTAAMKTSYEEQIRTGAATIKTLEGANSLLTTRLRNNTIRQAVQSAALNDKSGVNPSAIEDIVNRALGVFSVEGEDRVIAKAGDAIIYGADGTTPMTPAEWVASLKESHSHYFKASTGGGGATNSGGFGGFSSEALSKMGPEERIAAWNEAHKPKGY